MFIDSRTEELYIATPDLIEKMRQRWQAGEFKCLE
jgi:hypothetical protein